MKTRIQRQERMSTISVQISEKQEDNLYLIMDFEGIESRAELVRKAIDFYVEQNYPQIV